MLPILYEDQDIIVVKKPAGLESQSARGFESDMVSEIRRYLSGAQNIHKLATDKSTRKKAGGPPYVGVIHRLDKPVAGIMVYAKKQKAAASLSQALQKGSIKKGYAAVLCGKPVDKEGTYVDYLCQDRGSNLSTIVDKSVENSKRAVLNYRVRAVKQKMEQEEKREFAWVDIELLTGRHHQIRVQFASRGTPLYGDERYGITAAKDLAQKSRGGRIPLALCACSLAFFHPVTGKEMDFHISPEGGAFDWF